MGNYIGRQERLTQENLKVILDQNVETLRQADLKLLDRFQSKESLISLLSEVMILTANESWQDICDREELYLGLCDYLMFLFQSDPEFFVTGDAGPKIVIGLRQQIQQGDLDARMDGSSTSVHLRMKEILTEISTSQLPEISTEEAILETSIDSIRQLAFQEWPLDLDDHTYRKEQAQIRPRMQLTRVARELATLSRTMPVSENAIAALRVSDRRSDFMTLLLTGPVGTPYEYGCFIFDLYLPPTYPKVPPKCWLRTIGSGRVNLNPNLYSNGKVCLSLLGTWSGPKWHPDHSTILQIINSLQALVLVEKPFYNEPGYDPSPENEARSEAYNFVAGINTIRHTILPHIVRMESGMVGPFDEVMLLHFRTHRQRILNRAMELNHRLEGFRSVETNHKVDANLFSIEELEPLINLK